jgi:hypothetical protein
MARLLVLVAVFVLAGCGQTGGTPTTAPSPEDGGRMPADFAATIVYRNGTVAPPHHFEWRLRVEPTRAELTWRPGYTDETPWVEAVAVTGEQRAALYDRLRTAGVLDPARPADEGVVGGPTGSVEATASGRTRNSGDLGLSEHSQDALDEVRAAAEELVPDEVWDRMAGRQRAWGG